jgi:hypothetical protein
MKEESELDGMVPLVIMPLSGHNLKNLFTGTSLSSGNDAKVNSP